MRAEKHGILCIYWRAGSPTATRSPLPEGALGMYPLFALTMTIFEGVLCPYSEGGRLRTPCGVTVQNCNLILDSRNGNLNPQFSLAAELSKLHQKSRNYLTYRKLAYVPSSYYRCQNREDACVLPVLAPATGIEPITAP